MKLLTPQQMREIDRLAINKLGIPGIVLMENAAINVVTKSASILKGKGGARITIVAGAGNNGGDAFAVARHLLQMGYQVSVFSMISPEEYHGDALINAKILLNFGFEIITVNDDTALERMKNSCLNSHLVIDGLLGTGISRNVEGIWLKVIDIINNYSSFILSIDIPSGIDGLTGKIMGACINADATITFFLPKIGMLQYPGAAFIGELTVADIGIPYALADDLCTPVLLEKEYIRSLIPERYEAGHKGTFGNVLNIAGSQGMTGAAFLSTLSAYRTGTGIVRLLTPESCIQTLSTLIPEAVFKPLPENQGHALACGRDYLEGLIKEADAVLAGPGLSCCNDTRMLLELLVECCDKPMVFDADALNILAEGKTIIKKLRGPAIITPHPAEMGRLAGISTSEVMESRISIAQKFAHEYGLTVVLKGAGTVISDNHGNVAINPTGNDGMATAGSGDVLAGIVVSFLAQGLSCWDAAVAGVYLHGLSGDFAAQLKGRCLMAHDIADNIPAAFKQVSE